MEEGCDGGDAAMGSISTETIVMGEWPSRSGVQGRTIFDLSPAEVLGLDSGQLELLQVSDASFVIVSVGSAVRGHRIPYRQFVEMFSTQSLTEAQGTAAALAQAASSVAAAAGYEGQLCENIPMRCLEDPHMELRPWGSGQKLWPYCTACGCWSDNVHLDGERHRKQKYCIGRLDAFVALRSGANAQEPASEAAALNRA